jgi:1-deoxyxylulose-5-phosphate synthase
VRLTALGRTSIEVSEFIFGAGTVGGIGGNPALRGKGISTAQGLMRLDEAWARGITVIDTADVYGGGESELAVGRWLDERAPQGVLVQTKTGAVSYERHPFFDLSREHIGRQLRRSIGRLGRVDLYLSHGPDPDTPLEETLEAFAEAQESQLIRAFGMSNVDAALLERVLQAAASRGLPRPEWVQNGLNLLERGDERDLIPLAAAEGIGYTPYSPLAGGILTERYLDGASAEPGSRIAVAGSYFYAGVYTEENLAKVARLRTLARERAVSVAGLALAWLRAHPSVTAPLIAPSRPEHWSAVDEALRIDLGEEEFAKIAGIFT